MLKKELGKILLSLSLVFIAAVSCAQYVVTGGSGSPMKATQSSGDSTEQLEVYLVYGMDNVAVSYTSSSSSSHQWYRCKAKRLEAEKMASAQNGATPTIRNIEERYGHFVEEGAVSRYAWIVDYSKCILNISNLHASDNSDPCSGLVLARTGTIQPIYYYQSNTGARRELSRQLDVIYGTLGYDSDKKEYTSKQKTAVTGGNLFGKSIPAPWCNTKICVKGDYFAHHFGKRVALCIDEYRAAAVDVYIDTLPIEQEAPNINTTRNGYCIPTTVQLSAIANTPTAALSNWKIYRQGEENNPVVRFASEKVDYTFNQSGTFIVKLKASDQSTTCSTEDEVQIDISESYSTIPNAFSPGATPGINDEFQAAHKSLMKFKAWISNRQGLQMYYRANPAQGRNGKKGDKYVQPGMHFYVIGTEDSDDIKYKEKGGINIPKPKTIQDENENIQE